MNQLVSVGTGKCVSVAAPFEADGAPLVQQTCAVPQATNQLFHIRPLP